MSWIRVAGQDPVGKWQEEIKFAFEVVAPIRASDVSSSASRARHASMRQIRRTSDSVVRQLLNAARTAQRPNKLVGVRNTSPASVSQTTQHIQDRIKIRTAVDFETDNVRSDGGQQLDVPPKDIGITVPSVGT